MGWRTVVISRRAKLDLHLNYLVVRTDETLKIHIAEISTLILENTAISITGCLLSELIKQKVKVVFCDEKRNPSSELLPYYGSHDTSNKVRVQIAWKDSIKGEVWTNIITEKIKNQKELLKETGKSEYKMLEGYLKDIEYYDTTNREGHAAKVYFNALFGKEFSRSNENNINAALNYGYSIILSAFNREVVSNGYITQVGLFHDNMFNQFNLSSDLMEPFRPLIDRRVIYMNIREFEREEKLQLVDVLNEDIIIDGKHNTVDNAIKIYAKSVLDALSNDDISLIRFYRNEL